MSEIRPLANARCATPATPATQKRRRPNGTRGTPEGHRGLHPTPATQKRRRPRDAKGTPGRTSDPLAAHIVSRQKRRRPRDARGTPGRTSDPLAVHMVPRLPRKRRGDQGTPDGHRGVHPTPWRCTLCYACHAKAAETKWHQRDARGTPEGRQGVHPTPWQCTLCHACHAKAAETKGHQRRRPNGTRGTPDVVPRLPRKSGEDQMAPEGRQRDARAYIRPLGNARCATPATQKQRRPRGTRGTPEGRQGVHPTPLQ